MSRRTSHLRAVLLTAALGVLGAIVLALALSRPSVGRFLAAGLLLGAAVVVRQRDRHRDDPEVRDPMAEVRSLVWSLLIVVVFVGASLVVSRLLEGN